MGGNLGGLIAGYSSGISYVSGDFAGSGSSATVTTTSVVMPNIIPNDVAIYALVRRSTSGAGTASTPTGFTLVTSFANTSTASRQQTDIWYKKLVGTEGFTTFSTSWATAATTQAALVVYRGVDTVTQIDGTQTTANSGTTTSTTVTYPSYTATVANCMYLRIGGVNALGSTVTITTPTSHTSRVNLITNRGAANYNVRFQIAERLYETAGGTDSGNPRSATATTSPATHQAIATLALRPAQQV
jgi:hypothetical protein